jgi:hypothetical protein
MEGGGEEGEGGGGEASGPVEPEGEDGEEAAGQQRPPVAGHPGQDDWQPAGGVTRRTQRTNTGAAAAPGLQGSA